MIASTLLGARPPVLPVQVLVRSGQLFGLSEGTVRVALSRMVSKGEIVQQDDGRYALTGHLLDRQAWQERGRRPRLRRWKGEWVTAVVVAAGRTHTQRSAVRGDMRRMRMAELREGVWMRPDNLAAPPITDSAVAECLWATSRPEADPAALAASLWDLDGWSRHGEVLRTDLADWRRGAATDGTAEVLAPGFVLSAAVLRHFNADPLLPLELLPESWPGDRLRAEYEAFDAEFLGLWRSFMG